MNVCIVSGKDTNILSEQINQDVTRIHRLELENKKLSSELEELKLKSFHESSDTILKLEKDNKKLSMTLKQLEELHNKDSEDNVELENRVASLNTKNTQLQEIVATLKETEDKLRIEKDTEIDNLKREVDSLRKRQEKSMNDQLKSLEEENKKLVKV